MPDVAVVGGSLGGLTAAHLLRDAGCAVTVYERSNAALEARGAGIAVLDQTLRYPLERLGLNADEISTTTQTVRFLDGSGRVVHAEDRRYRFSAWNTIYRVLHEAFPTDRYLLGREVVSTQETDDRVLVTLADGSSVQSDLVVCADGIGSPSRQRLLPEVSPEYAGYIAWRGTVPEADLTQATLGALHDAITYQVLPFSHILVYPIPGGDGSVEPGHRLMNMVWYRNVTEPDLVNVLTDRAGTRRAVSVPPGEMSADAIGEMRAFARQNLAPALADMVTSVQEPFVQAVFDISVPRMAFGRICLLGDAAFAARPHAAAGTAKAAEDGWVLSEELIAAAGDVAVALPRWEARQHALGEGLLARTREIGTSSQARGDFRPGDPRLVFGLYGPGR